MAGYGMLLGLLILQTAAASPPPVPTEMLSVAVPLRAGEYVASFEIATQGVEPVAVCRIPAAWTIGAGGNGAGVSAFAGEAAYGAAAIGRDSTENLGELFLVRMSGAPVFNGRATVIPKDAKRPKRRIVRFGPEAVRRVAAANCPAPAQVAE